jgi:hypothetical protein
MGKQLGTVSFVFSSVPLKERRGPARVWLHERIVDLVFQVRSQYLIDKLGQVLSRYGDI